MPEGSDGAAMEQHHKKTIYQFTTSSPRVARAIEMILKDHRCIELLTLFARLQTPRRRNTLLRVAGYLGERPLKTQTK